MAFPASFKADFYDEISGFGTEGNRDNRGLGDMFHFMSGSGNHAGERSLEGMPQLPEAASVIPGNHVGQFSNPTVGPSGDEN